MRKINSGAGPDVMTSVIGYEILPIGLSTICAPFSTSVDVVRNGSGDCLSSGTAVYSRQGKNVVV